MRGQRRQIGGIDSGNRPPQPFRYVSGQRRHVVKIAKRLERQEWIEAAAIDDRAGRQYFRKLDAVANDRVDIKLVSGLGALLHRQRLGASDIEQRSNMHL